MPALKKTSIITALIFIAVLSFEGCHVIKKQKTDAQSGATLMNRENKLIDFLQSTSQKGIMIGHQDDLAYGIGWKYPNGKSDVYKVLGYYPVVFGWDLGGLENVSAYNLDSVPF